MSRVGKKPIPLPKGVKIAVGDQLQVEGPKGKLTVPIPHGISISQADGTLHIKRDSDEHAALHGLTRALAANAVHWGFYPLLFALMVSGYLISTSDGRPIAVFDWFSVPALFARKGMEDTAGEVHEWLAYITIALVVLHAAASLKHHFIDRNRVLTRMWSGPPSP